MSAQLDPVAPIRSKTTLAGLALALAVLATLMSTWAVLKSRPSSSADGGAQASRFQDIKDRTTIRVGYGGFPPYTIINPNEADPNKRVTGFSVDLVNEIASRSVPPLKVEWHQFAWDVMKADLAADRFDFIADPVFQTIPRATDFALADPYSFFGIGVALVRLDETRFARFEDLDRPDITIALAEGWTSSEFARANLTKPTFKGIPVSGDAFSQLDEVLFGRADVALNDVPTVFQYVAAHPGKVKALWLDDPPSSVPGSFLLRQRDIELLQFLNSSLRILRADGTVSRLDTKWKSLGFFVGDTLRPGVGLGGRGTPAR